MNSLLTIRNVHTKIFNIEREIINVCEIIDNVERKQKRKQKCVSLIMIDCEPNEFNYAAVRRVISFFGVIESA